MTNKIIDFDEIFKKIDLEDVKGEVYKIGPYTVTAGSTNQSLMNSDYDGVQCTTMALTAIVYWQRIGFPSHFMPKHVNKIIVEGNSLHSLMRDHMRVSRRGDGMVGLYDIPYRKFLNIGVIFDTSIQVRLANESLPVFTSYSRSHSFLGTLSDYLRHYRPGRLVAFLITIKFYSYAILRLAFGAYCFFDSHGYTRIMGRMNSENAVAVYCPTLSHLIDLVCGMHGYNEQVDVAPLISDQRRICTRDMTDEELIPCEEEMENPYISLMAH